MSKIKTNEFYVINQPKYSSICIVDGGVNFRSPLSALHHEALDKLYGGHDIVFIFPKSSLKYINPEKFSTLYQACMYVIAEDNMSYTFIRTLNYIREVFTGHTQFLYLDLATFDDLDTIDTFRDIKMMSLNSCVLRIERCDSEEFYSVYSKRNWWEKDDMQGIHKIYYTPDPLVRLSFNGVNVLRKIEENYYKTFKNNIQEFIPCAIKYYGIEYIDKEL